MVGGRNSGLRRVCVGVCEGRSKNERLLGNKQGQRCDVRAQRRDVPERGAANVATLRSNVATFRRGSKSNVATLGSNVATFQRSYKPTSRRWDPMSQRYREAIFLNVATLGSKVATFQGVEMPTSRR